MNSRVHRPRWQQHENGYALLLLLFLVTLLALGAIAVTPNIFNQNQREKEAEMIWRGRQYARGVKLFFLKTHRFPTSLDDLTKPGLGVRFMRQAYKDPMNSVDGSWRVIYVGPTGQPIGSLRTPDMGPTFTPPPDGEQTNYYGVAGNAIMGVGSKVNKKSVRWYEKAKNYRQFEFTWVPGQDLAGTAQAAGSQGIGVPVGAPTAISPAPRDPSQANSSDPSQTPTAPQN